MGEVLAFHSLPKLAKTLDCSDSTLRSLEGLGYERYSIVQDEHYTVEIESYGDLHSVHFTPKQWSKDWYLYYIEVWFSILDSARSQGINKFVNFLNEGDLIQRKLHVMFGFEELTQRFNGNVVYVIDINTDSWRE